MYTLNDGQELIKLARRSVQDTFSRTKTADDRLRERYKVKQGTFVTLNKHDDLRGCIGFVLPYKSLYEAVIHCAKAAAFEDPRFPPVRQDELKDITIDVSILTVPHEIKVDERDELLERIKIGRDGLIIRKGMYSGLLLPQVFVEYNANPKKALEMLCQKAGLATDAWRSPDAVIESFQAQVFKETAPNGEIVEEKLG